MANPRTDRHPSFLVTLLIVLGLSGGLFGCAAAAVGAGAGAVAGIAYTDRGAKGDVKGDVKQVNERATRALQAMKISITGRQMKESGKKRELSGKSSTADIHVEMTQAAAGTTHVEVVARESTFKWNKDYAKEILANIIKQG